MQSKYVFPEGSKVVLGGIMSMGNEELTKKAIIAGIEYMEEHPLITPVYSMVCGHVMPRDEETKEFTIHIRNTVGFDTWYDLFNGTGGPCFTSFVFAIERYKKFGWDNLIEASLYKENQNEKT